MNPRVMLAAQRPLPLIEPPARQVGVVFGSSSLPVAVHVGWDRRQRSPKNIGCVFVYVLPFFYLIHMF